MAIANLLIKIGADIAELKTGSDKAIATMEKTGQRIDTIGNSIKSTLLTAFSVGAVVGFGKELLRMGDDIVRVADRTGLLTDEVQKLSYIAGQSGNTLEDVTSAIGQLQNRVGSGDKSALKAIEDLGLSFNTLRRSSPYEQLAAIAGAFGKVEDRSTIAQRAVDLFGKAGLTLIPLLTAEFDRLAREAPLADEAAVRAADAAGDAFDKMQATIKAWALNAVGYFSHFSDGLVLTIYPAIGKVLDALAGLYTGLLKVPGASRVFGGLQQTIDSLRQSSQWYKDAAVAQGLQLDKAAEAAQRTRDAHKKLGDAIANLTAHTTAHTTAGKAHVKVLAEIATVSAEAQHAIDLLAIAQQHQASALALETDAFKATQKAAEDFIKALPTGKLVITDGVRDLSGLMPQVSASAATFAGNLAHAGGAVKAVSSTVKDDLLKSLQAIPGMVVAAFTGGGGLSGAIQGIGSMLGATLGKSIGAGFKALGTFGGPIGEAIGALAGPLIGKIVDMFGTAGRQSTTAFAATFGGFDALHTKLGELGAEGEQLWIRLTQGVGRNNPQQAQAAIDAINEALGRQKTKQEEAGKAATDAGQAQSDASQKARDAIQALDDEMSSLFKSIANEAPEEVMGVVESQTRARIAAIAKERDQAQASLDATAQAAADGAEKAARIIEDTLRNHDFRVKIHFDSDPIPGGGTLPGFQHGTHGRYLNFGAGMPVMLHGRERVVTEHEQLGTDGGDITVMLNAGELWDQRVVTVARKDAARGGLRPRARHGRSY